MCSPQRSFLQNLWAHVRYPESLGSAAECCSISRGAGHVRLFVTPRTIARQALSMGFSRQECQSGLPFPPPGDLPHPGIKPGSAASPESAGRFFTTAPPGKSSQCPTFSTLFLAMPRFTQGFSSLTGDPASVPCSGSRVLASGPLEKSLSTLLDI